MIPELVLRIRRAIMGWRGQTVALSPLELKALWLLASYADDDPPAQFARDDRLRAAGVSAVHKIWLVYRRTTPPRSLT